MKSLFLYFLLKNTGVWVFSSWFEVGFFSISEISRGLKNFSYPSKWKVQCRADPLSFEITGGFLLAAAQFDSLKFSKAAQDV